MKTRKYPGAVLGGTALAVSMAFIGSAALAADPINIGMIAPTTGVMATVGQRQLATAQWWEGEVNGKGGIKGRPVRLIHCNDEANPEKAVSCVRDLLARGSVLLINSSVTGPIRATMPLIRNGPVMVTPSPNVMPEPSSYVFQTSPSDMDLTRALVEYLHRSKVDSIGVIAATDASGELGVSTVKTLLPASAIKFNLARIDLRATDASIQLAQVAKSDVRLIYSTYSGGGAATVVKSFNNLGLEQPLVVSYANLSDQFIALIRNDMPQRLLGLGLKGVVPELLADPAERERVAYFARAWQSAKGDSIDQLNLNALTLVDTIEAILRNGPDTADAAAVKAWLEKTPIRSFQTLRFSPQNHIGMNETHAAILEYKSGRWVPAPPVQ
jgi:branched-chain amino acid transport system substrate-binding protein